MRRPIRTRRLSIAAIVSCAAFWAVAAFCVQSFRAPDQSRALGRGGFIDLSNGCIDYMHMSKIATLDRRVLEDPSFSVAHSQSWDDHYSFAGFSFAHSIFDGERSTYEAFFFGLPLWPWLLLLLIAPVRWIIARPSSALAFPIITDAMHPSV